MGEGSNPAADSRENDNHQRKEVENGKVAISPCAATDTVFHKPRRNYCLKGEGPFAERIEKEW
jgi:hypothetical protein